LDDATEVDQDIAETEMKDYPETNRDSDRKGQCGSTQNDGEIEAIKQAKAIFLIELEQLSKYNAELHQSCDFATKNFEISGASPELRLRDEELRDQTGCP